MNKSYYAIIPANVRYDKELTPNAKLIYGEITALCNEKGYCWASNSYFSELYEVSNKSVSKWINQLIEKKYLSVKIIYKEDSKEIKERRLYIYGIPMEENFHTYGRNVPEPMEEKVKDNNTVNNTNNIYKVIQEKWNNEVPLPSIRSIANKRKSAINARLKEYNEETVLSVIDMVSKSDFLLGKVGDWNNCNFDWVFNPNNFIKILEGNYNKPQAIVKEEKQENRYNPDSEFKIDSIEDFKAKFGNLKEM